MITEALVDRLDAVNRFLACEIAQGLLYLPHNHLAVSNPLPLLAFKLRLYL